MNRMNCGGIPLIKRLSQAAAVLTGSEKSPDIYGVVSFYTTKNVTLVYADVDGLPYS